MNTDEFKEKMEELGKLRPEHPRYSWGRHRYEIQQHVKRGDDPENFLHWSTITGTMFHGESRIVENEYNFLLERGLLKRYNKAIAEHSFGNPVLLSYDQNTSGNLVHQVYHLSRFEDTFSKKVEELNTIVEFGGGYGAMCAIIRRLGFNGQYVLYDLPEITLLQKYYLTNVSEEYENDYYNIDDKSRFRVPPHNVDLLIASYSLSEAPAEIRKPFLDATNAKYILIVHQAIFDSENLNVYFDQLMKDREHLYNWTTFQSDFISGSRYILGEHTYVND